MLLRLVIGVIFEVVVLDFIGGNVVVGKAFSASQSEFSSFWESADFLTAGAIKFNISFSFFFSATILVRSDKISFLSDALISSSFSDWI